MPCPKPTEIQVQVLKGTLKGAVRGCAVGATAAIFSGAAVILATPVWVPWVGGAMLISASTLASWAAIGAGSGALTGGAWGYVHAKQRDRLFHQTFGKCRTS